MLLVEEFVVAGFELSAHVPKIHCKVFEDNSGALEMARAPKSTKHMNLKYHHFRDAVQKGNVTIHAIDTRDQLADVFTKPLGIDLFKKTYVTGSWVGDRQSRLHYRGSETLL
jgi:hypothetical protein